MGSGGILKVFSLQTNGRDSQVVYIGLSSLHVFRFIKRVETTDQVATYTLRHGFTASLRKQFMRKVNIRLGSAYLYASLM